MHIHMIVQVHLYTRVHVPVGHGYFGLPLVEAATDEDIVATTVPPEHDGNGLTKSCIVGRSVGRWVSQRVSGRGKISQLCFYMTERRDACTCLCVFVYVCVGREGIAHDAEAFQGRPGSQREELVSPDHSSSPQHWTGGPGSYCP